MPTLLWEGPYRFFFYSNEGHEPAHIHVQRDNNLAEFWLQPVSLAAAGRFSAIEIRNIQRLVITNRIQLMEGWNDYFKH